MTRNRCLGWRDGDPVTCAKQDGNVVAIGKVVVRKSMTTGRPFVKVQLQTAGTGLGRLGQWVWPEDWVIGQGHKRGVCLDCGQEFRTKDEQPSGFCLPCDRRVDQGWGEGMSRKPLAALRGASTPLRRVAPSSDEDIAKQKAQDEAESIF